MLPDYKPDAKSSGKEPALPFKECPRCGFNWISRESFLADPSVELIGYQTNFMELAAGLIYFNHACKGTFTLYANDLRDLYDGPIFAERHLGTDECPSFCLHKNNLKPCPSKCECASIRNILQTIKQWPKLVPKPPESDRQA